MQDSKLYEYAVVRLVPRVEREEFFNVGLIMFSKKEKFIRAQIYLCEKKFELISKELDYQEIKDSLENFAQIAKGNPLAGPIARLDISERFRWLTAVRSSVIQTSRPHPGKTSDLEETFDRLFKELVQ